MEEMAGLDPRLMDTAAIETFTHLLANNVAFLPYQQVVDLGGYAALDCHRRICRSRNLARRG